MSNNDCIQIGWFTLDHDEVFTNHYETAAWYEDVLVPAGKYPIHAYDVRYIADGWMASHCNSAYISMKGTIVSDCFVSLFCGVPISGYDGEKNKGNPANTSEMVGLDTIAKAVLTNDPRYELLPEFIAKADEERFYDSQELIDGKWQSVKKSYIPYRIYRKSYDGIYISKYY